MHRYLLALSLTTIALVSPHAAQQAAAEPMYGPRSHRTVMKDGKPMPAVHRTGEFSGAKVNGGYVTHSVDADGRCLLTLSDDFQSPDTPAPHWQVVDSEGNVFLLQRLVIKDDKYNKQILVPSYVKDVEKVQVWCAWAEALLGEAAFDQPVD